MTVENVKGVVWDLDGTLLDSFGIFEQIVGDVVAESGHSMPDHEFMLANFHGTLEETVQRILSIESATELDTITASFLNKQARHYAGNLETHLFPDAVTLAQQAAELELPQLLVTNRSHEGRGPASPKFIVAATTLAACINEVYPSDEIEYRKPDKRSISGWIERHDLAPEDVLVIGDQFVDAQLARNIGSRAILVKRNGDIPHLDSLIHANPETITLVDSLEEVNLA